MKSLTSLFACVPGELSDFVHGHCENRWSDRGMYRVVDGKWIDPYLEIQPNQFKQLEAVRDALKDIPASDGSGKWS
jgi:hypothetical protein